MSRLARHLLILIGLVAVVAIALAIPRGHARAATNLGLDRIPLELGPWQASLDTAQAVLPIDERSLESLSRVYSDGRRRLWVAVARYTGDNGPGRRPSVDALASTRGAISGVRDAVTLPFPDGGTLPAMRLSVGWPEYTVTTWYWYRLGARAVGDEYSLRLRLGLNSVLGRSEPLLLVRVAALESEPPTAFMTLLVRHLDRLVDDAQRTP